MDLWRWTEALSKMNAPTFLLFTGMKLLISVAKFSEKQKLNQVTFFCWLSNLSSCQEGVVPRRAVVSGNRGGLGLGRYGVLAFIRKDG